MRAVYDYGLALNKTRRIPDDLEALRAIRAKCLDCCGGSRENVENCRVPACALYRFRNMKALTETAGAEKPVQIVGQVSLFEPVQKERKGR